MIDRKIKDERQLTPEEKWERATIANNFIFYKVMRHNPDVCKELIEILLEMEIDRIEMRGEEIIETDFGSKGIRLDIYAKNETDAYNKDFRVTALKISVWKIILCVLMIGLINSFILQITMIKYSMKNRKNF